MKTHTTSYLKQKRAKLLQKLRALEPFILRGSLIKRYKRCGKPKCKCAKGIGHGPKYYLSVSISGSKPVVIYIPLACKEAVEKALNRYQDFRQIMEDITIINRELIIREKKL